MLPRESRRIAELLDLFTIEMRNEGATPCWAMLLIMDNGKTNQFGKLQYGVAGFSPGGLGDYFIPRAMVTAPKSLVQSLWPWVVEWVSWFQGREPEEDVSDADLNMDGCDLAGKGVFGCSRRWIKGSSAEEDLRQGPASRLDPSTCEAQCWPGRRLRVGLLPRSGRVSAWKIEASIDGNRDEKCN
jgi:hypothetical protein